MAQKQGAHHASHRFVVDVNLGTPIPPETLNHIAQTIQTVALNELARLDLSKDCVFRIPHPPYPGLICRDAHLFDPIRDDIRILEKEGIG